METRSVTLRLSKEVWDLLQRQDVPLEQAIARVLSQTDTMAGGPGLRAAPEDASFLCNLKDQLGYKFENARSWAELQGRLKRSGFTLRDGRLGLSLSDAETKEHICTLTSLSITEQDLVARFGRPFPKAAQRWLREEELENPAQQSPRSSSKERAVSTARRG